MEKDKNLLARRESKMKKKCATELFHMVRYGPIFAVDRCPQHEITIVTTAPAKKKTNEEIRSASVSVNRIVTNSSPLMIAITTKLVHKICWYRRNSSISSTSSSIFSSSSFF